MPKGYTTKRNAKKRGRKPGKPDNAAQAAAHRRNSKLGAVSAADPLNGLNVKRSGKTPVSSAAMDAALRVATERNSVKLELDRVRAAREIAASKREAGTMIDEDKASHFLHHLYSYLRHEAGQALVLVEALALPPDVKAATTKVVKEVIDSMCERMSKMPSMLDWEKES